ncbi:AfsR/SARP family transcriptional regulator [Streptomyces boncukensis]|uniref:AfsR/SARP family transcriptional regulator n=1 Tax=Streptomyces boncukensis TaxID=2711219 RepID=A0A6G4WRF3_9ACTN|nr:AfsR/SARP family transcriptional regulator [Streptomyces boncukensis]NGO67603.1 AfsR/SARP family transcriptional regulator [Streptomyces boncukensis]
MEFKLLGPLEVTYERHLCTPHAPKVKKVLALLLLRANHVVGLDAFIEELWGDKSPNTAITTTQTYVYHLRKALGGAAGQKAAEQIVRTAAPGYVLKAGDEEIDIKKFDSLVVRAQATAAAEDFHRTARYADEALSLWTGAPLADVECGNVLRGYAVNLEEQYLSAQEMRIRAEMQLGNHRKMIADLRSLVAAHPLNEWFHGQLITALHRSGRRSEALRAYQHVRELLRRELGLEPSPELWQLHQRILAADTGDTAGTAGTAGTRARAPHDRVPLSPAGSARRASAPVP